MNPHTWTLQGTTRLANGSRYRLDRCQACGATRKTTITLPADGAPSCEQLTKPLKCLVLDTIGQDYESGRR